MVDRTFFPVLRCKGFWIRTITPHLRGAMPRLLSTTIRGRQLTLWQQWAPSPHKDSDLENEARKFRPRTEYATTDAGVSKSRRWSVLGVNLVMRWEGVLVQTWIVFPRPLGAHETGLANYRAGRNGATYISSARMHPCPSCFFIPITLSYRNVTPSR